MFLEVLYGIILITLAITVHWSFLIMLLGILILGRIIEKATEVDFVVKTTEEDDSGKEP